MPIGNLDILSDQDIESITTPSYEEPKNPEAKTHIVHAGWNPHIGQADWTAQQVVDEARRRGLVVKALCGYQWIPKHDPDKLEACQICFDVAGMIMREAGE